MCLNKLYRGYHGGSLDSTYVGFDLRFPYMNDTIVMSACISYDAKCQVNQTPHLTVTIQPSVFISAKVVVKSVSVHPNHQTVTSK